MKLPHKSVPALAAGALLALAPTVSAHSWIEYAKKLAKNGTMIGPTGYPRGYISRDSTNPPYSDSIPQNILPIAGQAAYSGNEILNKFKYEPNPSFPMLEAAPGDYVAIMHLENGHTTLPQNQPLKPKNRGTVYFYGTSEPKDEEKLFDVHLLWNKDGTGGDKRGRLLATRNYDDGQCYQNNPGVLSVDRATQYASQGAKHDEELACQSDIKLPEDLKEGSVYTVYWYWDWPDLNAEKMDVAATTNGKFPWAGTFMRGLKDPNGFTMDAISKNESYSSVIDIKITGSSAASFAAKDTVALDYVADQNIYSVGIEAQMLNNFQVEVNGPGNTNGGSSTGTPVATNPATGPTTTPASAPAAVPTTAANGGSNGGVTTVTVTQTVQPPPSISTVYVTVPANQASEPTSTTTKTLRITKPVTATNGDDSAANPTSAPSTSTQYIFFTTHIRKPTPQPTSTVVKIITTHINRGGQDSAKNTGIPGGSFQETVLPENIPSTSQT
ncbi:hypothetical protein BGZ63DRAFT_333094, partial [Mariannaea sp. PMI_226]